MTPEQLQMICARADRWSETHPSPLSTNVNQASRDRSQLTTYVRQLESNAHSNKIVVDALMRAAYTHVGLCRQLLAAPRSTERYADTREACERSLEQLVAALVHAEYLSPTAKDKDDD